MEDLPEDLAAALVFSVFSGSGAATFLAFEAKLRENEYVRLIFSIIWV